MCICQTFHSYCMTKVYSNQLLSFYKICKIRMFLLILLNVLSTYPVKLIMTKIFA